MKISSVDKKIGIIIINWNGLNDTLECLKSLSEDQYQNKIIVVVDNKSSDNSPQIIKRKFSKVKIIKNQQNFGYAKATNIGIKKLFRESKDVDYVLILNNDVVIKPGSIKKLIAKAESSKKIGIVSPKILDPEDKIDSLGVKVNFNNGTFLSIARGKPANTIIPKNKRKLEAIAGSCFLVKKEVFEKSGFIPEEYFFYFEETDFCLQAKKSGYKIILEPKAVVCHKGGGSSNPEISTFSRYYFTRNMFIFMKKNAPKDKWRMFVVFGTSKIIWRIILNLGGILIKGKPKRRFLWAKAYLRGVIDFWRGTTDRADYDWLSVN